MNITEQFLQPGIAIAFWIIVPFAAVTLLNAVVAHIVWAKSGAYEFDYDIWRFIGIGAFAIAAVAVGVLALCLIPFQEKYWNWYVVEAHVTDVSNNFQDGSGDVTSGTYVLTLDGVDFPVVSYDDRASRIEGQDVTLLCERSWVDFGNAADKWACSIKEY